MATKMIRIEPTRTAILAEAATDGGQWGMHEGHISSTRI